MFHHKSDQWFIIRYYYKGLIWTFGEGSGVCVWGGRHVLKNAAIWALYIQPFHCPLDANSSSLFLLHILFFRKVISSSSVRVLELDVCWKKEKGHIIDREKGRNKKRRDLNGTELNCVGNIIFQHIPTENSFVFEGERAAKEQKMKLNE